LLPHNESSADDAIFGGIDWGGSFHQLCLIDSAGAVLLQRRIMHDVGGLAELDRILGRHTSGLKLAIERAEGLLVEHLHTLAVPVYCVSPKIAARARERYRISAAKSDALDAFVLADTLRHEHRHWRPLSPPSPLLAELRAVTRDRQRVLYAQQACESQLRAIMDAYHPSPLHLFSTLDRDITLAFIADYPTPAQASRVGTARMDAFCRRHGYSGRTKPQVLVDRLRPHLLSAGDGTVAGKSFSAELFADQLRMLNTHLRAYDRRISDLLDIHPDAPVLRSFPGIGPLVAATLISEMGEDRSRYPTAAALLADTGLAPVTRASGRNRQVRFRYAANRRMRHAIDWWIFVATREDDWSRTIYEAARAPSRSGRAEVGSSGSAAHLA
jgi:transposase